MSKLDKSKERNRMCSQCGKQKKDTDISDWPVCCDDCGQKNVAFYSNPPASVLEENQRRIFGKVLSDEELLKILQQEYED